MSCFCSTILDTSLSSINAFIVPSVAFIFLIVISVYCSSRIVINFVKLCMIFFFTCSCYSRVSNFQRRLCFFSPFLLILPMASLISPTVSPSKSDECIVPPNISDKFVPESLPLLSLSDCGNYALVAASCSSISSFARPGEASGDGSGSRVS